MVSKVAGREGAHTQASAAGIRVGDVLVGVNGSPVADWLESSGFVELPGALFQFESRAMPAKADISHTKPPVSAWSAKPWAASGPNSAKEKERKREREKKRAVAHALALAQEFGRVVSRMPKPVSVDVISSGGTVEVADTSVSADGDEAGTGAVDTVAGASHATAAYPAARAAAASAVRDTSVATGRAGAAAPARLRRCAATCAVGERMSSERREGSGAWVTSRVR